MDLYGPLDSPPPPPLVHTYVCRPLKAVYTWLKRLISNVTFYFSFIIDYLIQTLLSCILVNY